MTSATTNPQGISESIRAASAIDRCDRARTAAYKAEFALSKSRAVASITSAEAYREALPPLCGTKNIRDFISCVAHGLLIGVIDESKSSRLLYAARIALTSIRETKGKQPRVPH